VFDRPRPYVQGLWSALGTPPHSGSMPSGHATTAAAAATAVAFLYPELRLPAVVLAALICLSRVYLGVHFVSDVVVGALLGAAIGASVALLSRRLTSRTAAA
jgi:undecaprenyl-diphosphatase